MTKKNGKFIAMGISGAILTIGSAIGAFLSSRETPNTEEPEVMDDDFEEYENDETPSEEMGDPE